MTTEAIEQTEVSTPIPGDAGEITPSDAAAPPVAESESTPARPSVDSLSPELRQAAEAAWAEDQQASERVEPKPEDEQAQAAFREAQRELRRQAVRAELAQAHATRQAQIDALRDQLSEKGLYPEDAAALTAALKKLLNDDHSQTLNAADADFGKATEERMKDWRALITSAYEIAGSDKAPKLHARLNTLQEELGEVPTTDFLNAVADAKYEGYTSPKDLADIKKSEYLKGVVWAQQMANGAIDGTDLGSNGIGQGRGWKTKVEARALHVQGRLSNAQMRDIDNDPSIPEGR